MTLSPTVIRANSSRIWDIGDVEYPLIQRFLDDLPMNQLSQIESTSPVRLALLCGRIKQALI